MQRAYIKVTNCGGEETKTDNTTDTVAVLSRSIYACNLDPTAERTLSVIPTSVNIRVRQFISQLLVINQSIIIPPPVI